MIQAVGGDPYPEHNRHKENNINVYLPTVPEGSHVIKEAVSDSEIHSQLSEGAHNVSWTVHVGDWWGLVKSEDIPGPYDLACPSRWSYEELLRFPKHLKYVSLVRDGRNQIESLRNFKGGVEERLNKENPEDYFRVLCKGFRNRSRIALDNQSKNKNYRIFKYENLIQNPKLTCLNIFSFLGLTLDEARVEQNLGKMTKGVSGTHSSFGGERNEQRWTKWTSDEKSVFKQIAGNELIELGYESNFNW